MGEEEQTHVLPGTRRSGNDAEVASVLDLDDDAFEKAVGRELQYLRTTRTGLSRRLFVKTFPGNMPINTYACYEQGIRGEPYIDDELAPLSEEMGAERVRDVAGWLPVSTRRQDAAPGDERRAVRPCRRRQHSQCQPGGCADAS
jgi:hypothetical protein